MNKVRNANFELMRIISMLFIIFWHTVMYGKVIENCSNPSLIIIFNILQYIVVIHVNSFVLLSGYFQSKSQFKLKKVVKLILQVMFYLLLLGFVCVKLGFLQNYSITIFISNILPSCISRYWFIGTYIIMYLFSDYINKFINRMSRKEYKFFLILCFIILSIIPFLTGNRLVNNTGYNFFNFIFLYMIGGYFRDYPLKETYHFKNFSANGYRVLLLISFFAIAIFNFLINDFLSDISGLNGVFSEIYNRIHANAVNYSNPLIIIQTIVYFEFFRTLILKNKILNSLITKISGCVFGIYLFHENYMLRPHLYTLLGLKNEAFSSYKFAIYVFIVTLLIFIIGVIVEFIRKLIFYLIGKMMFIEKLDKKINNIVDSFNFNIKWD